MLRLVGGTQTRPARAATTVGLWGMDPELAAYVDGQLRARWPQLAVVQLAPPAPAARPGTALWICATLPPSDPGVPVLCLGEIDRSEHASRLAPRFWTCSMPITGRKLLRCITQMRVLPAG